MIIEGHNCLPFEIWKLSEPQVSLTSESEVMREGKKSLALKGLIFEKKNSKLYPGFKRKQIKGS